MYNAAHTDHLPACYNIFLNINMLYAVYKSLLNKTWVGSFLAFEKNVIWEKKVCFGILVHWQPFRILIMYIQLINAEQSFKIKYYHILCIRTFAIIICLKPFGCKDCHALITHNCSQAQNVINATLPPSVLTRHATCSNTWFAFHPASH